MFRFCAWRYPTLCGGGSRGADKLLTALINGLTSVNIEGLNALKSLAEAVYLPHFAKKECPETSTGDLLLIQHYNFKERQGVERKGLTGNCRLVDRIWSASW